MKLFYDGMCLKFTKLPKTPQILHPPRERVKPWLWWNSSFYTSFACFMQGLMSSGILLCLGGGIFLCGRGVLKKLLEGLEGVFCTQEEDY